MQLKNTFGKNSMVRMITGGQCWPQAENFERNNEFDCSLVLQNKLN